MTGHASAPTTWYLFSVNADTPPVMTIDSGEEVTLVVRGAFADVRDIRDVPTPFTPACDGHPLAPIAGPVHVRGAEPGDAVADRSSGDHASRGRHHRDPARLRRAPEGVRGAEGPRLPGPRRPRVVRRPHPDPAQPEPRHRVHDAARRVQALLRGAVRRRLRPEGRQGREPGPPPGHGAGGPGVLRRPARRDQRRHRHGHRRRVHVDRAGAHHPPQAAGGGAPDHRGGRHRPGARLRPDASRRPPRTRRGRPSTWSPTARAWIRRRPTCSSRSSGSSASGRRPGPSWRAAHHSSRDARRRGLDVALVRRAIARAPPRQSGPSGSAPAAAGSATGLRGR